MHYIIDGYNLLFRIQGKYASFEEKRTSILNLLDKELSHLHLNTSIVFDSSKQARDYAQKSHLEHLEIIFSPQSRTADDYIIEILEHTKSPKTKIIVTSDQGLARQCQHLGAQVLSIEEFIALIAEKRKKKKKLPSKPPYKESYAELDRLLKIFEKRLEEEEK